MDETQAARDRMAERLRLALALHEDGVDLMRQNIYRKYPSASEAEIRAHVRRWLRAPESDEREYTASHTLLTGRS